MPRCAGSAAQPASIAAPAAAIPPRNLRRAIPIHSSRLLLVLLEQCQLRVAIAFHHRRLEARRDRRAMPFSRVEAEPLRRNSETLAQQIRQFSPADHAAAERGIVVAPAPHFIDPAHYV